MSDNFDWNPEAVTKLTDLWNRGLSGNEIAAHFGHVMTRQSVIGKAHRLGLADRSPNMNRHLSGSRTHLKPVVRPTPPPPVKKPVDDLAPEPARDENGDRITVLNAKDSHCRFPFGEVGHENFHYCGHKTDRGSWCPWHRLRVFTPGTEYRGRPA